jgi:NAD(P)-dependent dehydrogenase (short-subunit alcohol dehydrogenase family)
MKYKVIIDVEVDEKDAELWFWECAMEYIAEDVNHGDKSQQDVTSYRKFADIKENYEATMMNDLNEGLDNFFRNAGIKNPKAYLHRMNKNKFEKSYKITIDNTI